jgi:hypothetical protein
VGIHRAEAIANWMRKHEASLGSIYTGNYVPSPTQLELLGVGQNEYMVPIKHAKAPDWLDGSAGINRDHRFNFISAQNDLEAIRAYLDRFSDKPHTLRSYTKELERFLYWCVLEANKPLSSVLVTDCEAYKAFLKRPSARFVGDRAPRSSTRWRPSARNRSPCFATACHRRDPLGIRLPRRGALPGRQPVVGRQRSGRSQESARDADRQSPVARPVG